MGKIRRAGRPAKRTSGSPKKTSSSCSSKSLCGRCRVDRAFLRSKKAPPRSNGRSAIRIVDLFGGCGGMSIGIREAAYRLGRNVAVALAVDSDQEVVEIYNRNFPGSPAVCGNVARMFGGKIG